MSSPATVDVSELISIQQQNPCCVIVDVRSPAEVARECYVGCVNVPLSDLSGTDLRSVILAEGGDLEQPVYLLCQRGQRSQTAAKQLTSMLSNPLVVVEGGIEAMKAANIPLKVTQQGGISIERQVRIAAGLLVVLGVGLGALVHPGLYGLAAAVGAGLALAGATDSCLMGMLMARMPWNKTTTA